MKPRLFLSHSSRDTGLTTMVKAALEKPDGTHPGYEVLLDAACLTAGESWPLQLNTMMADAHTGLLLFTRAVIDRPQWVLQEAYILAWRRSLDPNFKLFYALLDDVTAKDLEKLEFAPAHLQLIQALAGKTADAIAAEVKTLNPATPAAPTAFEQLADKVAVIFENLPGRLTSIAAKIGAQPVRWQLDQTKQEAMGIAARLVQGEFGKYGNVKGMIDELITLNVPPGSLKNLLKWIAPHWLGAETAGRLSVLARSFWEGSGHGYACVNGELLNEYTAKMLVDRVRPFTHGIQIAEIEFASDTNNADYYTEQICRWIKERDPKRYKDKDDVMKKLKAQQPMFVPIDIVDNETMDTLRARFPKVIFLMWTRPLASSEGDMMALKPAIDEAREQLEFGHWMDANNAIRDAN